MPVQHWTLETFNEFLAANEVSPEEGLNALAALGIDKNTLSELAAFGLVQRLMDREREPAEAMIAASVGMFVFGFEIGRREGRIDGDSAE